MMIMFRKHQIQTLTDWLKIATCRLTNDSKQRIRTEIETHYAEAVENHREEDLSETEANAKALAELGDARSAGKRFRKQHLTEWEARQLRDSNRGVAQYAIYLIANFLICWMMLRAFRLPDDKSVQFGLGILILLALSLPALGVVISRRNPARPNRHLLLIRGACEMPYWWLLLLPLLTNNPMALWPALVYPPIHLLSRLRIWLKLGKAGTISNSPPRYTAAS